MKKLAFLLGISLLILLMGQARATYTQTLYYFNQSSDSTFDTLGYARLIPENGSCMTTLSIYADAITTPSVFYNYQIQMIENGTTLFTSTLSGTQPKTCFSLGSANVSKGIINATVRASALAGTQNITIYLEIETSCETNNGYIGIEDVPMSSSKFSSYNTYDFEDANVTYGKGVGETAYPYYVWGNFTPKHCTAYRTRDFIKDPSIYWTWNKMDTPYFTGGGCYLGLYPFDGRCDQNSYSTVAYETVDDYKFLKFNSKLGQAQISISGFATFGAVYAGIFNPATNTIIWNSTVPEIGGYVNLTQNVSLEQFKDYVLYIRRYAGSGFTYPESLSVKILDYSPNWVCGAWSKCVGGQQQRLCNDTGGLISPEYQFRSCLAINQTAILGFESYYIPPDRYICQPNLFPICSLFGNIIANVTVLFPDNPKWIIIPDNVYFYIGTITSETATLGSRSLKLWYIPQSPYSDQPFDNNGTAACGNTTLGTFPEIFREINTSFMASLDFTFPAGTTEFRFDVKRCDTNVVQYDGWCGKRCYAQNCSIPPSGDFYAALYDQVENKNLFELTKEATTNWTTYTAFMGNAVENRNYTLTFAVLPLPINPTTTEGNCVYIDNVRLVNTQTSWYDDIADKWYNSTWADLTDEEKQTILLEECVNECIGNDYHIRTIQDLTCIEEVVLNYSSCVTQYQQQQTGNQSIFLPISSIANSIVNTTTNQTLSQSLQASGYGFVLIFLTPVFWIFMAIIAVMIVASYYTRHMEIGAIAGLLLLVSFAMYFPELAWLTIVIIIIAGYIIGRQVVRAVRGD